MQQQDNDKQKQVRKVRASGERTQRMMNFRCDIENLEWLATIGNKGRYINELIAADRRKKGGH